MSDKLLKLKQVEDLIGFKKSWIYKQVRNGQFPSPIQIKSSSRWSQSDVQKWITKQKKRNHCTNSLKRYFYRTFRQPELVKPLF